MSSRDGAVLDETRGYCGAYPADSWQKGQQILHRMVTMA
jgi:hypothetical protein